MPRPPSPAFAGEGETRAPARGEGEGLIRDRSIRSWRCFFRASDAFLLALAACSGDPVQPGQVTTDEARELNEAAAMLHANSVAPDVFDNGTEQEQPE